MAGGGRFAPLPLIRCISNMDSHKVFW